MFGSTNKRIGHGFCLSVEVARQKATPHQPMRTRQFPSEALTEVNKELQWVNSPFRATCEARV